MFGRKTMEKIIGHHKKHIERPSKKMYIQDDQKALEADWHAVGNDFKHVLFGKQPNK